MYYLNSSTMILLIPAIIISLIAQSRIQSTYKKYSQIKAKRGYTGAQVAQYILDRNGLRDVQIELIRGSLTDHYDPRKKVLRLSNGIYNGSSLSAYGIAAHEVGHAIQHSRQYVPLQLRNLIAPVASIGARFVWVLVLAGFFLQSPSLIYYGVFLYLGVVIFQLITLPVEFNASRRAIEQLETNNLLYMDEVPKAKKVLNAAAFTYVAATLVAVAQLLRLLVFARAGSRD